MCMYLNAYACIYLCVCVCWPKQLTYLARRGGLNALIHSIDLYCVFSSKLHDLD